MKYLKTLTIISTLLFAASASAADTATSSTSSTNPLLLIGLILVLALMVGCTWWLKKFAQTRTSSNGGVKIISGVHVGNRERILVVEVGDQWIVVGVSPGRINSLATMPRQESPATTENALAPNNFAMWLKRAIENRNNRQSSNTNQ